ncbi:phage tail protein [Serratia fonticola]|uniref:phage tail-collar fiber domain-containing protein n=1 Tax=Serratia fonticola TaxID=47917 RepID=UPI001AE32112|nr:phage tail protein [Serratia fonticola]MBP0995972.1 phage tail protein [Serratia fonticola]MBP1003245.1 phage tail protein [Serratia fonticola]MBP1012856.1 phage tail protein [Serratia fonticola]
MATQLPFIPDNKREIMSKYKAILTTAGAAKIAAASAGGKPLKIDRLAVGDGNGTLPTPNPAQTKLINERYRAALNSLTVDKAAPDRLIAELIIPASVGGFWLREMGLYDADGVLIAVSNMAESYKPKLEEGSGRTQTLRMVLIVSHTEAITLIVSGDMVTATRDFVAAAIDDHAKSRNHPDASTSAKGFVQLSSVTNSASETLAATPKAVKAVSDAAVKLAQNLADLPDKAKARVSLGLKAAALREVGGSTGQLMEVGAFGLGATCAVVSDPNEIGRSGFFGLTTGKHKNSPNLNASWEVLSICYDGGSRKQIFMQAGASTTKTFVRYRSSPGGVWGPFESYYSTENKPTAAEVGALTDAQAVQKYALRSIKVNGKPISADVNLLAGDVNAWNKTEADNRYLLKTGGIVTGKTRFAAGINFSNENTSVEGGSDAAGFTSNNLMLKSWYGIGFFNTCTTSGLKGVTGYINTRSGDLQMKGRVMADTQVIEAGKRVYSPNNKPTSEDVNAWNKVEADDRYLMKKGGQLSGIVKTSAEIQSTSQNNYRITSGNYGTFWRQDGNALYLLMTNAGDQLGSYSSHRPFAVSMPSGGVTLGTQVTLTDANFVNKMGFTTYTDGAGKAHRQANGLRLRVADAQLAEFYYNETVGQSAEVSLHNKYGTTDSYFSLRNDGSVTISGVSPQLNFNNGTALAIDGNVHGSVWGGYLSNFISNAVDGRVDWNSFNNRSHVAGSRQAWWYKDELTGFIFQGGVVDRGAGYLTWVGFPRGYTQDCFGVQLTLAGHWGDSNMNVEAQSLSAGGFNAAMGDNERVVFWWAVGV